jgi:hypothetical protein
MDASSFGFKVVGANVEVQIERATRKRRDVAHVAAAGSCI